MADGAPRRLLGWGQFNDDGDCDLEGQRET
mgnify:CR=1 FL=1